MKHRRAPRAARRGRKFKARPTSHDGLDVIAAYGNRPGYTLDGKLAGRMGRNEIECADGSRLSVLAGAMCHSIPQPQLGPHSWWHDLSGARVTPDYRGPYSHVEILMDQVMVTFDEDWFGGPHNELRSLFPVGDSFYGQEVPVRLVRLLIDAHGGFRRMVKSPPASLRSCRQSAPEGAAALAEVARKAKPELVAP